MKKLYLVQVSARLDRQKVIDLVSALPTTGGWFYSMPSSFFIRSSLSAAEISAKIQEHFGKARHFVTEVSANRQGIMPTDHWKKFYEEG